MYKNQVIHNFKPTSSSPLDKVESLIKDMELDKPCTYGYSTVFLYLLTSHAHDIT